MPGRSRYFILPRAFSFAWILPVVGIFLFGLFLSLSSQKANQPQGGGSRDEK
jgi:uncharacterized BrkB/YihY/UPF0761 family membrane protein